MKYWVTQKQRKPNPKTEFIVVTLELHVSHKLPEKNECEEQNNKYLMNNRISILDLNKKINFESPR